jgi:hypothetical protein
MEECFKELDKHAKIVHTRLESSNEKYNGDRRYNAVHSERFYVIYLHLFPIPVILHYNMGYETPDYNYHCFGYNQDLYVPGKSKVYYPLERIASFYVRKNLKGLNTEVDEDIPNKKIYLDKFLGIILFYTPYILYFLYSLKRDSLVPGQEDMEIFFLLLGLQVVLFLPAFFLGPTGSIISNILLVILVGDAVSGIRQVPRLLLLAIFIVYNISFSLLRPKVFRLKKNIENRSLFLSIRYALKPKWNI